MKRKQEKGITLISLVLTIIILIILAGVSINVVLGEKGILSLAKKAKEDTKMASEEEMLKVQILSAKMENTSIELGENLYDKTVENGAIWHLIIENESNKEYGTGWNYIKKGTNLGRNAISQYSWVINTQTGEMIKLEEGKYTELSYEESLGVKDGIILNLDSTIIDGEKEKSIEEIQKQLGSNVELKGFNNGNTSESGLSNASFNLDGEDDYIQIEYDSEEQKKKLAENGFTFEFYGILNNGNSYDESTEERKLLDYCDKGLFCYWDGNKMKFPGFRCFMVYGIENENRINWSIGTAKGNSDYMQSEKNKHIIIYPQNIDINKVVYISIILDCSQTYQEDEDGSHYKQILYINGKKVCEGRFNKANWEDFVNNRINDLKYFNIGRCSSGTQGYWHYSKMNAYTLRLYSKALTDEEVKLNYDKTVAYHNLLMK